MDRFYTALSAVINTNKERAKELVSKYNTGDLTFFQTYFDRLKSAKLEESEGANASVNVTLFVEEDGLGAGASGVIRKNKSKPYVYKSMVDMYSGDKRLSYLKPIFKELIIQTLLQSDTGYGKYVCNLSTVYRVGNNCVFQLEPLGITLKQYLMAAADPKTIIPVSVRLLEIINHFKTTYSFSHNDLRLDNVMTVKEGNAVDNIKLIDFGLSSVKIGDVELGKPLKSRIDAQYLFYSLKTELESKAYTSDPPDALFSDFSEVVGELGDTLGSSGESPIKAYIDGLKSLEKKKKGRSRKSKRIRKRKVVCASRRNQSG